MSKQKDTLLYRYTWISLLGCSLLLLAALVNISSTTIRFITTINWFFDWLYAAIIASALIPLAIGLGKIFDLYFKDHIRRGGLQMRTALLIYAVGEILAPVTIGSVVFGSLALLVNIFARAIGFRKLDHTLLKIRKITEIQTGGLIYQFFGFYYIIISIVASLANVADDEVLLIYIYIFKGYIEAVLTIMVAIKLFLDIWRVKNLIKNRNIQPKFARIYGHLKD